MADEAQIASGDQQQGEAKQPEGDPKVAELSRESAAYRTQRNTALREAHAYKTILKAHGIDTASVTSEALSGIPISGGKADGEFKYTPPEIKVPKGKQDPPSEKAGALTLEEVRKWHPDEINRRWDEVSKLMASTKR